MPKEGVELMPEPEDRAILTAVDRGAEGYSGEDYGLSDKEARDPVSYTHLTLPTMMSV